MQDLICKWFGIHTTKIRNETCLISDFFQTNTHKGLWSYIWGKRGGGLLQATKVNVWTRLECSLWQGNCKIIFTIQSVKVSAVKALTFSQSHYESILTLQEREYFCTLLLNILSCNYRTQAILQFQMCICKPHNISNSMEWMLLEFWCVYRSNLWLWPLPPVGIPSISPKSWKTAHNNILEL
jgi:hypothetical protein